MQNSIKNKHCYFLLLSFVQVSTTIGTNMELCVCKSHVWTPNRNYICLFETFCITTFRRDKYKKKINYI